MLTDVSIFYGPKVQNMLTNQIPKTNFKTRNTAARLHILTQKGMSLNVCVRISVKKKKNHR